MLSLVLLAAAVKPTKPSGLRVLTKSALRMVMEVAVCVAPGPKKVVKGLSIAIVDSYYIELGFGIEDVASSCQIST